MKRFALYLGALPAHAARVASTPALLTYTLATASNDGQSSTGGFDGKGNALPAEMLPSRIQFNDVNFQLASGGWHTQCNPAKGQTMDLPSGHFNRV